MRVLGAILRMNFVPRLKGLTSHIIIKRERESTEYCDDDDDDELIMGPGFCKFGPSNNV